MIEGRRDRGKNHVWIGRDLITITLATMVFDYGADGLDWGYIGNGPKQLSLAILDHFCEKQADALAMVDLFCRDIISKLPAGSFIISESRVAFWLAKKSIRMKPKKLKILGWNQGSPSRNRFSGKVSDCPECGAKMKSSMETRICDRCGFSYRRI